MPTLEAWKASGRTLAIFSSGSVQAQLQFFSYVQDGSTTKDVKPLFAAHYDTVNAGPKVEKESYEKISSEMGCQPSKVTFLTDNVKGMSGALRLFHLLFLRLLQHTVDPSMPIAFIAVLRQAGASSLAPLTQDQQMIRNISQASPLSSNNT